MEQDRNKMKLKNILYVILAIAVIATVIFFAKSYIFKLLKPKVEVPANTSGGNININTERIEIDKLPPNLPADLPIEKEAAVIRNEIVNIAEGAETQHVRTYYSKKTPEILFTDYKSYFEKNNWQIVFELNDKDSKLLAVNRNETGENIRVDITKNSITSDVTVSIMWLVRKNQ